MQNLQHEKTPVMQVELLHELQQFLSESHEITAAILYGSIARGEYSANSDLDIALIVDEKFNRVSWRSRLKAHYSTRCVKILEVVLRNKIVLYLQDMPKIEFFILNSIEQLRKYYLGSEIPLELVETTVLKDDSQEAIQYLKNLYQSRELNFEPDEKIVKKLLAKFLYEFESCSKAHARSDAYQFYYFYNIALHVCLQIHQLSLGHRDFLFLPKKISSNSFKRDELPQFYNLTGSLFLLEANKVKRNLLSFFYDCMKKIGPTELLQESKQFCETIFERDFIWNFRDASKNNTELRSGFIFRTSSFTHVQNEEQFKRVIRENKIGTVIDLRADREILKAPYEPDSLQNLRYVHAPFDPWEQSEEFQAKYNNGTDFEIAYQFFSLECKESIAVAIRAILHEQRSVAIHCHAGKDRTGIVVSILHLLSGGGLKTIYRDYLASEMDTKISLLRIFLEFVDKEGGIINYLGSCGLSDGEISQLKSKLIRDDTL